MLPRREWGLVAAVGQRRPPSSRKPLLSCSYSAVCAYTADSHHAAMMSQIGGCKEVTEFGVEAAETMAWKPAVMVGGCVFAS